MCLFDVDSTHFVVDVFTLIDGCFIETLLEHLSFCFTSLGCFRESLLEHLSSCFTSLGCFLKSLLEHLSSYFTSLGCFLESLLHYKRMWAVWLVSFNHDYK